MQDFDNKPKLKKHLINTLLHHKNYNLEQNYTDIIAFIYVIIHNIVIGYFHPTLDAVMQKISLNNPILKAVLLICSIIVLILSGIVVVFTLNWAISTFIAKELEE